MICLDTNVVIDLLKGPQSVARTKFDDALTSGGTIAVSTMVAFELWFGAGKSARREGNRTKIAEFLTSPVQVWTFGTEDAEEAGEIRVRLARAGTPIGPYDLLIAAQARRRGAVLVTANTREFRRVPGLQIEDWTTTST